MVVQEQLISDPIERLVQLAYESGASDIHIEPGDDGGYQVRVRLNGQLERWEVMEGTLEQTVSRIKLKARMDIAERRLPQDGSFRVIVGELDVCSPSQCLRYRAHSLRQQSAASPVIPSLDFTKCETTRFVTFL